MTQVKPDEIEAIKKKYETLIAPLTMHQPLSVEEFEKDVDDNFHVDFIHSMANGIKPNALTLMAVQ